ncbi:MAG: cell surface protein [Verrucomicrobia bacterium]|nr:cell surface protein [Verrucomicrobiota bacterium]
MRTKLVPMVAAMILAAGGPARTGADVLESIAGARTSSDRPLSPTALVVTPDGKTLWIACATANQVAAFDIASARVTHSLDVPESPSGLALSKDGSRLYVACAAATSAICVVDTARHRIVERMPAGHTAMSPVLSPDEKTLYVCNRFNHDISVIDLATRREVRRIGVQREPVTAAITPDGKWLVVANHLQAMPANNWHAVAAVSVINTAAGQLTKHIHLAEGSGLLRGLAISPDGRFAAVTHLCARYWFATTQVEMGRITCNALSVLDLTRMRVLGTLLLDQTGRGAANPWAVAWTPDGKTIVVSHAGTHEVSLVDAPVEADPLSFQSIRLGYYMGENVPTIKGPPAHPVRVRQRIPLPGQGPRALAVQGTRLYVANYFSDNLCVIDFKQREPVAEPISLATAGELSLVRKGEMFFNDASLCSQGWQSCASCHDPDGRMDAFDWDLLNDGVANPKNTKSLLWAHLTPPAMSLGVRTNAEVAVRAGLRHILFSDQPGEVPAAMDAYLKSLQPVPSPYLVKGKLSHAAERGREIFRRPEVGCVRCHPPGLLTDLASHDVGTASKDDNPTDRFDTPTLVELWRTAPYLHDGRPTTLRDVLTTCNPLDLHGKTSHLSPQEIDDLAEYLLSL